MEVGGEWEKEGSGWSGVWALQLVGGSDTGRRWSVARGSDSRCLPQGWPCALQAARPPLRPRPVETPQGTCSFLRDRGRQQASRTLSWKGAGTFPFQNPRLRDQGMQESNSFRTSYVEKEMRKWKKVNACQGTVMCQTPRWAHYLCHLN